MAPARENAVHLVSAVGGARGLPGRGQDAIGIEVASSMVWIAARIFILPGRH